MTGFRFVTCREVPVPDDVRGALGRLGSDAHAVARLAKSLGELDRAPERTRIADADADGVGRRHRGLADPLLS